MSNINAGQLALVRAIFSDEFATRGVDYDTLLDIAQGDIGDWIADLHSTGLFMSAELEAMSDQWRRDPAALASILLGCAEDASSSRNDMTLVSAV